MIALNGDIYWFFPNCLIHNLKSMLYILDWRLNLFSVCNSKINWRYDVPSYMIKAKWSQHANRNMFFSLSKTFSKAFVPVLTRTIPSLMEKSMMSTFIFITSLHFSGSTTYNSFWFYILFVYIVVSNIILLKL